LAVFFAAVFFFAVFADRAAALGLAVTRADFLGALDFFFAAFAISKVSLLARCRGYFNAAPVVAHLHSFA
jgi:hypothetical protein